MATKTIVEPSVEDRFVDKPTSACFCKDKPPSVFKVSLIVTLCIIVFSIVVGLIVLAVWWNKQPLLEQCYDQCFPVCQPNSIWKDSKRIHKSLTWNIQKESRFSLFTFPQEPFFTQAEVDKPLFISPYIEEGRFDEAVNDSLVTGLQEPAADNIPSYSGFITLNNTWESNLFFWLFPAQENADELPLVVWLQGGPGSTSLYGLFKENGPYLVEARKPPYEDPHLVTNPYSWHKAANILYVDNPIDTGFSHAKNTSKVPEHTDDEAVAAELAEFLHQFLKLYPSYVGAQGQKQFVPRVFLFGESYGGTYVTTLADLLTTPNTRYPLPLAGVGIGNGWLSPRYQCKYADFLLSMGLITDDSASELRVSERLTASFVHAGALVAAAENWQKELVQIGKLLSSTNLYDLSRAQVDITEKNYWHFLQKPHVRKALHVGKLKFQDGSLVVQRMRNYIMSDQLAALGQVLDRNVPVLVYHGIFDALLPVSGMTEALANTHWIGKQTWAKAARQAYWHMDVSTGGSELMGYRQTGGGLSLVVVRNSGHMVPMDQPMWSLRILHDFVHGHTQQLRSALKDLVKNLQLSSTDD